VPSVSLDTADAMELAGLLQLLARWLASDPRRLGASLLDFIGHPAYGPRELQDDLHRLAFLIGGTGGEELFGLPEQP
jgi:hypothetical protein